MKKRSSYRSENYWPGYVDALVNVILNLVFMVAVFLIALVVASSVEKANVLKTEIPIVEKLKNVRFGDFETDLDFGLSQVTPQILANFQNATIDRSDAETSGPIKVLPFHVSSEEVELPSTFSGFAPKPVRVTSGARPAVTSSEAEKLQRHAATALVDAEGDETSSTPQATATEGDGNETEETIKQNALPESLISIVIADGYSGRGGPNAQLSKRIDSSGRTVLTIDLPVLADPVTSLSRDYLSDAFKAVLPLESERFTLLFTTELDEPTRRRSAYLALSVIRNQLIQVGVDPARIDVQLLNGRAINDTSVKIFVIASGN